MLLAASVIAAPKTANHHPSPSSWQDGFQNPSIQSSIGGKAVCISGTIEVTASAENTHFKIDQPANQTELTELVVELTQINSTLVKRIDGGQRVVSGTYGIYSQLCFPTGSTSISGSKPLQFLMHGGHFGRSYWNNAPDYSYIDYAANEGYSTFFYDRLGIGDSEHPDPVQTVQTPLQVAIAHELVQLLRRGHIGRHAFDRIVGVGHSYGSAQIAALTPEYPDDFDAVVLTGAAAEPNGLMTDDVTTNPAIASQADPLRFSSLPNGYYIPPAIEGLQYIFFRAPNFDPKLLDLAQTTRQTQTVGELLAFGEIKASANFTGPIYVVTGEHDVPNCLGNCLLPYNKLAVVKDALYPAASNMSDYYVVPGAGHGLNYHYSAKDTYAHIHGFLKANGL